jgi:hypothetical protein
MMCFSHALTTTASPQPSQPVRGVIRVDNDDTGTNIGYLSRVLNQYGEFGFTVGRPADPDALIVEIPGAIYKSGGNFFNLPSPVSVSCPVFI